MSDFAKRRKQLTRMIAIESAQALLVTNFNNVTYLTGFTGDDSYLLVTRDDCWMISDPRYEEQIGEECPGLKAHIRQPGELTVDVTVSEIKKAKLTSLLVEGDTMTAGALEKLKSALPAVSIGLSGGLVESLRAIKDKTEIDTLRLAVKMAERVFTSVRAQLRGDQTELQVANEIDRQVRCIGGSGCSFKPIVAVGPRAALPHARPGGSRIDSAPFVLIDWGGDCEPVPQRLDASADHWQGSAEIRQGLQHRFGSPTGGNSGDETWSYGQRSGSRRAGCDGSGWDGQEL